MQTKPIILCFTLIATLAGCSLKGEPELVAKNVTGVSTEFAELENQVSSLKKMTKRIQRQSLAYDGSQQTLGRHIDQTTAIIDHIQMSLPALLASQDIALADLSNKMTNGETTEAAYALKADAVTKRRGSLAHALSTSAAQVQSALEHVLIAQSRGVTGLGKHQASLDNLARDIMAAYVTIDMLG